MTLRTSDPAHPSHADSVSTLQPSSCSRLALRWMEQAKRNSRKFTAVILFQKNVFLLLWEHSGRGAICIEPAFQTFESESQRHRRPGAETPLPAAGRDWVVVPPDRRHRPPTVSVIEAQFFTWPATAGPRPLTPQPGPGPSHRADVRVEAGALGPEPWPDRPRLDSESRFSSSVAQ